MSSIKHEVWQEEGGETMLYYARELGEQARRTVKPHAKLIHTFYASSHCQAMTIYYQFIGLGDFYNRILSGKEPYK